ncbi:MAG TPA: CPBP family intramembrane glutamic endopeptidase [Actinomycetota bacterium]|nr:CPBP family intramembrane glutamic endopeptidase [Actinomycetota bacterium]
MSDPSGELTPPSPPLSDASAPDAPETAGVPWTGRDLLETVFAGGGVGLVLALVLLLPFAVTQSDLSPSVQLTLLSLVLYGSLCTFGWWFALKRRGAGLSAAGFTWVGWKPIAAMIPAAIGLIVVNGVLLVLTDLVVGDVPTAQEQVLGGESSLSLVDLAFLIVAGAMVAPVAEEFLFRGLLYRYLRVGRTVLAATLISALAFAVAHFVWILIPSYIVFGIAEALVTERYKSLYPAIALHALNNGTLFVALYIALR